MRLDVPGGEIPEVLYDSPALGSPRAAQTKSSPVHAPEDIGVGSLVEVATDVDQHYYGVVKWIGIIDGKRHQRLNTLLILWFSKKI